MRRAVEASSRAFLPRVCLAHAQQRHTVPFESSPDTAVGLFAFVYTSTSAFVVRCISNECPNYLFEQCALPLHHTSNRQFPKRTCTKSLHNLPAMWSVCLCMHRSPITCYSYFCVRGFLPIRSRATVLSSVRLLGAPRQKASSSGYAKIQGNHIHSASITDPHAEGHYCVNRALALPQDNGLQAKCSLLRFLLWNGCYQTLPFNG